MNSLNISNHKGVVLIFTFVAMAALAGIAAIFLYMTAIQLKSAGYDMASSKALWLAEAGLQKAVWNLMTPIIDGGQGENWVTGGTAENLGDGNYTIVVNRWDFASAANGASVSASSSAVGYVAANATDGSESTYWESQGKPSNSKPEEIIVHFPYTLTLNKVRFLTPAGSSQEAPKDYTWEVSADGVSYTIIVSVTGNNNMDKTDEFSAATNVRYLKFNVSKIAGGSNGVRIATLEAIGSKITSTGTVGVMKRKIERTVVTDDATQAAFDEIDWDEIVPAV